MGCYIYGDVTTNIQLGTEMWNRLQTINARYEREIKIVEHEREVSRGWFRKPRIEKWYQIVDGFDNMLIAEAADQHGVELYLLGMINGDKINQYGWIKKEKVGNEERLPNGTLIREDVSGRKMIIESSIETDNKNGYGVYLYKILDSHISLYRREFTILKEGAL